MFLHQIIANLSVIISSYEISKEYENETLFKLFCRLKIILKDLNLNI